MSKIDAKLNKEPRDRLAARLGRAAGLLLLLGLLWLLPGTARAAQTTITFSEPSSENNFPIGLTLGITATSNGAPVVAAEFVYHRRNEFSAESLVRSDLALDQGQEVRLSYQITGILPPSTPLVYYWIVTDSDGNEFVSPEAEVRYDDIRFDWQIESDENIAVWWHDRSEEFGQQVYDIARQAFIAQQPLFRGELANQIRIIIYNDFDEFAAWNINTPEFVGGQAYPDIGVTAQIVSAFGSQDRWLNSVIPHEISHLYLSQVAYNPTAPVPTWLNEGLAEYNEFGDNVTSLAEARQAGLSGELIPLTSLATGFGSFNETRVRLAYSEGLSAVTYMVATYGEEGVADLLAAYRAGNPTNQAFEIAFGVDMGQFQQDWVGWLGVPEGQFVTPTPWPLPTFPASPTPRLLATSESTPVVETPLSDIPTSTPTAAAEEATEVAQLPPTEAPPTAEAAAEEAAEEEGGTTLCPLAMLLAPLALLWAGRRQRLLADDHRRR